MFIVLRGTTFICTLTFSSHKQVGVGCVGFWEENLLAKQSPEKVTRDYVYNQNGYDTRSRDRRSTLVNKQINKSDDVIMWLYTSCKPHKKGEKNVEFHRSGTLIVFKVVLYISFIGFLACLIR